MLDDLDSNDRPDDATLLEMYRRMTRIRLCGERCVKMIRNGRLTAPYYSARGQEVIPVALSLFLDNRDYLVTIYRGMHDQIAKGMPFRELWAEWAGRIGGACKGKGGPMHITYPAAGIMVTTGVVGGGIPIANGLALASQERADGRVTWCSFGDGAANIGAFHEALNMASLWKLPVVFVCQNNQYSEHTSYRVGTSVDSIAKRGVSYSMPAIRADGNDPIEMWRAARDAVARARKGHGPTLIEAVTFRFEGHVYGDPGKYIPVEEYQAALKREPYPLFRAALIERGLASEESLRAIDDAIQAELDDAVEFAMASPLPGPEEIGRDVYAKEIVT